MHKKMALSPYLKLFFLSISSKSILFKKGGDSNELHITYYLTHCIVYLLV